jgi:hypothetical protein
VKHLTDSIHKAAGDAAHLMSAEIRASATEHGWHPDVVAGLNVHYDEGRFNVEFPDEHKDRAFVHEFGDEHNPPTAVLRKYAHQSAGAQKFFTQRLTKHLGGKL